MRCPAASFLGFVGESIASPFSSPAAAVAAGGGGAARAKNYGTLRPPYHCWAVRNQPFPVRITPCENGKRATKDRFSWHFRDF